MPELYCRSCWRMSEHSAAIKSFPVLGVYVLGTLGVGLIVRPYRCRVCGQLRFSVQLFPHD